MKRLLIPLIFAATLVSCGPSLSAGTVVGKEYEPEDYWYESVCYSRNENGFCTFSVPTKRVDDEDWYVIIEGSPEGKVIRAKKQVTESLYEKCRVGREYPDCDPS